MSSLYDNTYGSYILGCHVLFNDMTDYTYMIQIQFTQSGTSLSLKAVEGKRTTGYISSSDLTDAW